MVEIVKQNKKTHIITYADNYACVFFRKQGFVPEISLERWKWDGFIKEYKNGTLMEYVINEKMDIENGA